MNNHNEKNIVYFNTRDEMLKVDLNHVVYFQADRNYTEIFFINGAHVTLTLGLINIEKLLNAPQLLGNILPFIRIGRGYIINSKYIFHINVLKQELVLSDTFNSQMFHILVPKEALKKLKNLFKNK